jgi:hypothetical protein
LALQLLRWRRHSAMALSSAWGAVQTECMCVCRFKADTVCNVWLQYTPVSSRSDLATS